MKPGGVGMDLLPDWITLPGLPDVPGLLLLLGLGLLAVALLSRVRRWLAGQPAARPRLADLARVPRRYLVHVHDAVHRDPLSEDIRDTGARTARMHVLAAGGFVAASALIVPVHLLGWQARPLVFALLLALAAMAGGTALVFARRLRRPLPRRLSRGDFDRLPWALAAFVVFFFVASLPAAGLMPAIDWAGPAGLALLTLGLPASLVLYAGAGTRAMRHGVHGLLHLAFHPRPARFAGGPPDTALEPLDLDAPVLGAGAADHFAWNRLLGFDACVHCGRCEAACPAFAAGQPLSPKQLVQDLAASPAQAPLVGPVLSPDTLWACTTCMACVYECPMMIEHVDAVVALRRHQTLEHGAVPPKAAEVLDELRETDTVSGRALASRLDWAADLSLPVASPGQPVDVLLWIGEAGFDTHGQRTLRALVRLLRAAGVDFAVLGARERDCGHLARRLGDEATFAALARANIETLDALDFGRIVTTDPHVLHTLRNEYPACGGHYEVEHHASTLARLIAAGRLAPGRLDGAAVTFHDPCYLGRYNGEYAAPREVLAALGTEVREMTRSGPRAMCCGWGGGAAFTDVAGERRIPDLRMAQAQATGAGRLATACPNCAVMLEGVTGARAEVKDLAELLAEAIGEAG